MKRRIISFAVVFSGTLALWYAVRPDDSDLGRRLFIAAFAGMVAALMEKVTSNLGRSLINRTFRKHKRDENVR